MDKDEYERRAKPMLWAMFANGALSRGNDAKAAASLADSTLAEYEKRFPLNRPTMIRPITPPGRIACDPPAIDTRAKLLEYVNELNTRNEFEKYWTVTVLYNTVVYRKAEDCEATIVHVFEGVLK